MEPFSWKCDITPSSSICFFLCIFKAKLDEWYLSAMLVRNILEIICSYTYMVITREGWKFNSIQHFYSQFFLLNLTLVLQDWVL